MLEPQLEHDREEYDRWLRRKRFVAVGTFLSGVALLLLFIPDEDAIVSALVTVLILGAIGMGYCEHRMATAFRRDLRERKERTCGEGAEGIRE